MSLLAVMFTFQGRIDRRTFWLKGFLPIIVVWALFLGALFFVGVRCIWGCYDDGLSDMVLILAIGLFFFMLWISLAVCCKRLHDLGQSGWWSLLMVLIIPSLLGILLTFLILGMIKGQASYNRHDLLLNPNPPKGRGVSDSEGMEGKGE